MPSALVWAIIVVVALIVLYFVYAYNRFVTLRNRIDNAWSQIDVQLKRRFDLIPNLLETVKGYMKHERETLKEVTAARTSFMKAQTPGQKAHAENMLEGALKTIFAVAESYPKLRASENFMQLQEELSGTESKIAYARQAYNDNVLDFNTRLQSFPSNAIGRLFGFKECEFFKTEGAERNVVKVKF